MRQRWLPSPVALLIGAVIVLLSIGGATMQRVFEPFFTTKDSGTGLGLAIVRRLVQAHGGEILLENSTTGGVRATGVLPVMERVAK